MQSLIKINRCFFFFFVLCALFHTRENERYAGEVTCFTVWQYGFMAFYTALIFFPLIILWLLYNAQYELLRRKQYASLCIVYKKDCWFYESILMGRRIILITIFALPKTNIFLLKSIMAFLTGFTYPTFFFYFDGL